MRAHFAVLGTLVGLVPLGHAASAEAQSPADSPSKLRLWSGSNALTVPSGRFELGLFGESHYGVTDSIEIALHPLLELALPHLEAKVTAARDPRHALGLRTR
ncbi:MAG TPA: hypothetical protein VMS65_08760, partial [Polyangiaceae bacterium]|nr:hypothetical protein [Polyangiaceae bacterium]